MILKNSNPTNEMSYFEENLYVKPYPSSFYSWLSLEAVLVNVGVFLKL
jgi:hypothetical protein